MQIVRKALRAVTLIDIFVKDQTNHFRLILVDLQVQHCAVALIDAAFIYRAIAIRNCSAGVMPLLCELPQAGFRADRGFQTLAGGLPVADVVQKLIHMVIKSLLAFFGAPYLNAVIDEPFHNKRRFVITTTQPVKHENEKDIEGIQRRLALDLLYGIALLGRHFESGDAFFGKLPNNVPAHLCGKLMTPLLLHGDVVFFDLL